MNNEQKHAAEKSQGEQPHPDSLQKEDPSWEELWLPEEDAVPSEPAWLVALYEQMLLPPEPDDVSEAAWIIDTSEEAPTPPEPPWYERYWIDDPKEWEDSPGPIHPSGRWQVLYIFGLYDNDWLGHAVVCDVETKKWVWIPDEAQEIAWSPDGREVGVIREFYECDPNHPVIRGSPLQRVGNWHTFERYTWPERKQISVCPIHMPIGWPIYVAISPCKDMAVFLWHDQGEAGLEFIALSEEGDYQIRNTEFPKVLDPTWRAFHIVNRSGGFPVMHALPTNPAFSPSGRFIALGLTGQKESHQGQIAAPAFGNLYRLGEIFILDWDERTVRRIVVADEMPGRYNPRIFEDDPSRFLEVDFIDEKHISLKLTDGRIKTYHIQHDSRLIS